ncbi:glycosyl hydrolase family protein [Rhizobium sp. Kim5]|uniref:hypothetical protein n=1 Tax=Rhizobium sp. Kim5 TaxID=2020311 RepID=UPI000A2A37EE|nr:hypothetical protein [Rhizobium sp. Kim5]ARQ56994.1 glycosyl hydrolase family protein [Rhizobium sp. Kim5]
MPQIWQRLGRVIEPRANQSWWQSHASYPTALVRADGLVDVYFSVRGASNRSSLARTTLSVAPDRFVIVSEPEGPLLEPGRRGAFDADGVTVGCVVRDGDRILAYYLGWTVGVSVPFTNFIGLAIADGEKGKFRRYGQAPIVGRSEVNPFTVGYPWVIRGETGYIMWFGSHLLWGEQGLDMEHVVKMARSSDGLEWTPDQKTIVPLIGRRDPAEFAISRPTVVHEKDGSYSMWYARRRPHYEIGYAHSTDGENWTRNDQMFMLNGEPQEWEESEQTYPCVFDVGGYRYMLYNGDGYGGTGFGLAVLTTL